MTKYILEIISSSKKIFKSEGVFFLEGVAYLEGNDGEGERVEIRALVCPEEKPERSKPRLIINN